MDAALNLIKSGFAREGTGRLVRLLEEKRRSLGEAGWKRFACEALAHPIRQFIHADPFTFRAFSKPRGYAGDAGMMDYIYGYYPVQLAPPVDEIFAFTTGSLAPQAIRSRRQILARAIDRAATDRGRDVDVIAVASGHLREVELSAAVAQGRACVTALDADQESLSVVSHAYAHLGVTTLHGSVRQILNRKIRLPRVDLIYAAGLYDYLHQPLATRLTTMLFDSLGPRGTLLLANFLPDIQDAGYMESFMDWHLIYRTDSEMLGLTDGLPPRDVARIRQFHDPLDNITFLEITKRPNGSWHHAR